MRAPVLIEVGPLPAAALAASAAFHADVLPRILAAVEDLPAAGVLTLVFAPAPHEHRAWREAAVQTLARACAPRRVNALVSDDPAAIAAARAYLEAAPGITGHCLVLDGTGAGAVV